MRFDEVPFTCQCEKDGKKKKKDKKRKKTKKTEGFKFRTYGPFSNDVAVKGLIITDS